MSIYVYPGDIYGCGYYRLIWPAKALQRAGYDVKIIMPNERDKYLGGALDQSGNLVDVRIPDDAEVIVMQRISHERMVRAVELIRARGVGVVVDIDDDLAAIHRHNPAWESYQVHTKPREHSWRNVVRACQNANVTTTSTKELTRWYAPRNGECVVIPNHVPARYLDVPHSDSATLGWGGSIRSHPDDLQAIGHAISRLEREGHSLLVVGPVEQDEILRKILGTVEKPECTGGVDLQTEWPEALTKIGVGIAPLSNTRFNRSKSRLKVLEYASLGVPFVASPRIEYSEFHKLGVGLLAKTPSDWYRQLSRLLSSADLRVELSERGRETAREMTIEANVHLWWDAWSRAGELAQRETPSRPLAGASHPLGEEPRPAVQFNRPRLATR